MEMTVNTIALLSSCQTPAHGTRLLSRSSGAVTTELLKGPVCLKLHSNQTRLEFTLMQTQPHELFRDKNIVFLRKRR